MTSWDLLQQVLNDDLKLSDLKSMSESLRIPSLQSHQPGLKSQKSPPVLENVSTNLESDCESTYTDNSWSTPTKAKKSVKAALKKTVTFKTKAKWSVKKPLPKKFREPKTDMIGYVVDGNFAMDDGVNIITAEIGRSGGKVLKNLSSGVSE